MTSETIDNLADHTEIGIKDLIQQHGDNPSFIAAIKALDGRIRSELNKKEKAILYAYRNCGRKWGVYIEIIDKTPTLARRKYVVKVVVKNNEFLTNYRLSINKTNDGSQGKYRGPEDLNITGAKNDLEAISNFLKQYEITPVTLRTYAKEAERFHMWAILKAGKSIADMSLEDYEAYIDFLKLPDDDWTTRVKVPKTSPDWRPFLYLKEDSSDNDEDDIERREASAAAVKVAIAALTSMLSWMVDAGYLRINPLKVLRHKNKINLEDVIEETEKVSRYLDDDMWSAAKEAADLMPRNTDEEVMVYERLRFMLTMFSMLGPRVSELSRAKMGDMKKELGIWTWKVVGKGNKAAILPLPQDMIDGLIRWRKCLGLPAVPTKKIDLERPIIPALNAEGKPIYTETVVIEKNGILVSETHDRLGLSDRRINEILKEVFFSASKKEGLSEDKIEGLLSASAHWMRHTSITQKVNSGMDRFAVQKDARHSNYKTTEGYTHEEMAARSEEAQKHRLGWK